VRSRGPDPVQVERVDRSVYRAHAVVELLLDEDLHPTTTKKVVVEGIPPLPQALGVRLVFGGLDGLRVYTQFRGTCPES